MNLPGEEILNGMFDKHRGIRSLLLPFIVSVGVLLGAKIVWPRDSIAQLAAQANHVEKRIDSVNFRVDSIKLLTADRALVESAKIDEVNRKLLTLSILACSSQPKATLAYRLAGCDAVLAP